MDVLFERMAKKSMQVKIASGGSEAIQSLGKEDCDIADLRMKDMDGIEVLKVFRKRGPGPSVVTMTGRGSAKAANKTIKFGALDHLTKPCDLDDLVFKIREAYKYKAGQ